MPSTQTINFVSPSSIDGSDRNIGTVPQRESADSNQSSVSTALSTTQGTPNIREAMMNRKSLIQSRAAQPAQQPIVNSDSNDNRRHESPQVPPLVFPQTQLHRQQEQTTFAASHQYRPPLDNLAPLHQHQQSFGQQPYHQGGELVHEQSLPYGTQSNANQYRQSPSPQTDSHIHNSDNGEQGVFIASAAAPLAANRGIRDAVLNQRPKQAPQGIQPRQLPPQAPIRETNEDELSFERRREIHRMNTVSFRNIYSELEDDVPTEIAPGKLTEQRHIIASQSPQFQHSQMNNNIDTHRIQQHRVNGRNEKHQIQTITDFNDVEPAALQSSLLSDMSLSRSDSSVEITDSRPVIRAKDSFYVAKAHHHEHSEDDFEDEEDDEKEDGKLISYLTL